jgi:hypothetical protein
MATPAQVQQLLTQLGSLVNSFATLERALPGFVRTFEDYNNKFQKSKDPTGAGGDKGILDKLENFFKRTLIDSFKKIDALTNEALGRNTRLKELNLRSDLGMPLSELGDSIFDLRDSGFRVLNDSTQKLISRMKLTGQSTGELTEFLAENSYLLNLNNQESQDLVESLTRSGLLYQVSQEKTLEALNMFSKKIGEDLNVNLVGGTKTLMEAFTTLSQELGMRNSRELIVAFNSLFGQENLASIAMRIPGLLDMLNRAVQTNDPKEAKELLKQSLMLEGKYFKSQISSSRDLLTMNAYNARINETFGLENVKAVNAVNQALLDNKQVMVDGIRQDMTFEEIQKRFYSNVEKSVTGIHGILSEMAGKNRSTVEAVTDVAGTAGIGGVIGGQIGGMVGRKIAGALAKRAAFAAAANVVPVIGTVAGAVIGVGLFAKDLYDIYSEWNSSNEAALKAQQEAAAHAKKLVELREEEKRINEGSKISIQDSISTRLSRTINEQILALAPGDKSKLQAKNVEILQEISLKMTHLIDVNKNDRLTIPEGLPK